MDSQTGGSSGPLPVRSRRIAAQLPIVPQNRTSLVPGLILGVFGLRALLCRARLLCCIETDSVSRVFLLDNCYTSCLKSIVDSNAVFRL